jgi:hypothetical protein
MLLHLLNLLNSDYALTFNWPKLPWKLIHDIRNSRHCTMVSCLTNSVCVPLNFDGIQL